LGTYLNTSVHVDQPLVAAIRHVDRHRVAGSGDSRNSELTGPQVPGGLAPPGDGKEEGQVGEWAPDLRNIFTREGLTEYGKNPIMFGEEN
jgi:hypothetical protein